MPEKDPILWEIIYKVKKVGGSIMQVTRQHRDGSWKVLPLDHPEVIDLIGALQSDDLQQGRS